MVVPLPQAVQTGSIPYREAVDRPDQGSHVTILMCTYNGERFLSQQLDSIARQSFQNWDVLVSDDGSTDATLDILRQYAAAWGEGKLTVRQGPQRGFATNFLSVACVVSGQSEFYAWADQDDIWQEHKLKVALKSLQHLPMDIPALYCARTELIDDTGTITGRSPMFPRPPCFANALVQSIAGGNTMVFNRSAQALFQAAGAHLDIVSHDWWAYLLVTGTGGQVVYDHTPTLLYRQHDTNLIGSDMGARARLARLRMMFSGRFKGWNQRNIAALESVRTRLSKDSQLTLDLFQKARRSSVFTRFFWLRRSGVYRQTMWGSLGLILAAAINRL
nr:glycosyltransferase family 2 protein [Pseudomonas parakoreensis]